MRIRRWSHHLISSTLVPLSAFLAFLAFLPLLILFSVIFLGTVVFFQYILRMKYFLIVNHICYLQQRFWLIYFGCYLTLFFCLKVIYFYPYIQMCLFSIIIFFRKTQNCFIFLGRTSRFHFYFLCICQTLWHILYAQKILSLLKEEFKGKLWE